MTLNKLFVSFLVLSASFGAHAEFKLDYAAIVERSHILLEKMVNAKPISGCEEEAAAIIIDRLIEAGIAHEVVLSGDAPATTPAAVTDPGGLCLDGRQPQHTKRPNIIARLSKIKKDNGAGAFMIMAHIDVVPAIKQVWSPGLEAHKMKQVDNYFYGRGVIDMLSHTATAIEFFIEIKKMNLQLDRDLVLMLNSNEELGGANGVGWLVKNRPDLFNGVSLAISEGGSIIADEQQIPLFIGYEAAQKRYQDFKIVAVGTTGHSSTPTKFQSTNLLNEALSKIRHFQATPRLIPLIQSYFIERAKVETDETLKAVLIKLGQATGSDTENLNINYKKEVQYLIEKNPVLHAFLRRTCTNTVIEAGSPSAKNAQPQTATAYVNCRLMPDENVDDLLAFFKSKIDAKYGQQPNDPKIEIMLDIDHRSSHADASDINGIFPQTLAKLSKEFFQDGIPVIPSMLAGATDLRYLRKLGIDSYGFGPAILSDSDRKRSHGVDERLFLGTRLVGTKFYTNAILEIIAPSTQKNTVGLFTPAKPKYKKSTNFKNAFESADGHGNSCHH